MRRRILLLAASIVLATTSSEVWAGECRELIDAGRLPPRTDAECAEYDAGIAQQRELKAAEDAADMEVIDDYFNRNPTVARTDPCKPFEGSASSVPWMVSQCRRDVESMSQIDAYFKAHPKAKRPEDCSLPLRSGFLGACVVWIEAAEVPEPKPEWHRVIKDTVGCYRNGVYSNGTFVGATEGCKEVHAGEVFLLRAIPFVGKSGKITYLPPLSNEQTLISNGVSSLTLPTDAFDPRVLRCQVKTVLLHRVVSCDD